MSTKVYIMVAFTCIAAVQGSQFSFPAAEGREYLPGNAAADQHQYCIDHDQLRGTTFDRWTLSKTSLLLTKFPVDSEPRNFVRKVHNSIFSHVTPTPFISPPTLAIVADEALINLLDLDPCDCVTNEKFLGFVSGSWLEPRAIHLAHRYGGHQFGYWAGQLGDGRAVLLGEYVNEDGEKWELQLKGSGKTPYSRRGDGRAVLRSSVREFLVSEAMYHLGVPTSRAASLVVSEDKVWRDQFYNGNPALEKTAIVLRLAPSWFRFGSVEILHRSQEYNLLQDLVDFVIEYYFPHISSQQKYVDFFATVVNKTAELIALWQSVGFAHGVCNTDNFSLLSITIDYGPFGFLDSFVPEFVPNSSDDEARYSFENQPHVALFNLQKLLEAMSSLFVEEDLRDRAKVCLYLYPAAFNEAYLGIMKEKLGLVQTAEGDGQTEERLIGWLLKLMVETKADYTMTFRELSETTVSSLLYGTQLEYSWALGTLQTHPEWRPWVELYAKVLRLQGGYVYIITSYQEGVRMEMMQRANPRYILRNYMVETAIRRAEHGDFSEIHRLYRVLKRPFVKQGEAERARYAAPPPSWAQDIVVSCSS